MEKDKKENLEIVNTDQLRAKIAKSIVDLESTLADQITLESSRVKVLRDCITNIESSIFDKEFIDSLPDKYKIALYRLASENMNAIITYLMDMHKSLITNSADAIKNAETLNSEIKKSNSIESDQLPDNSSSSNDKQTLVAIQNLIKNKIKDRVGKS